MALGCSIIPQVRSNNGEIVDSKLFTDIMSLTNKREAILGIYQRVTSSFFLTENADKLQFDEYNEPTLDSILANFNIDDILGDKIENSIIRSLNEDNKTYENTANNVRILSQKASSFNDTSTLKHSFIAIPKLNSDGRLYLNVVKNTEENQLKAEKMKANLKLNDFIRNVFAENGLKIGAIDKLEESLGTEGLIDFSVAEKASKGIVELVKLTKGIRGEKALPEEYAHLIIDAMDDDPFVARSLNSLRNNTELVAAILGDEYNTYLDLYDSDQMAREALGKLLTLHLLNSVSTNGVAIKPIIDKTINSIKNKFSAIDENQIIEAINDINKAMDHIAQLATKDGLKLDLSKIRTKDVLRHIDTTKAKLQKIIDVELKRYDLYTRRSTSQLSEEKKDRLEKFEKRQLQVINKLRQSIAKSEYNKGILDYLSNAIDVIDQLNTRLEETVGSLKEMNYKAYNLNNIQDYIDSYNQVLDALTEYSSEVDSEITPEVREAIKEVKQQKDELQKNNNRAMLELYALFLSDYLTDNTTDHNNNRIDRSDLEKLLQKAYKDVTVVGSWLSAVQNMNDPILKLADKAIKSFKNRARKRTQEIIDKLDIADKKLKASGINDYLFMYQKYSDGSLSEYYISEINWALYREIERQMFKDVNEKYGTQPTGEQASKKRREIAQWYKANFDKEANMPKADKYGVTLRFENEAQEEYYKTFKELRKELIKYIPNDVYKRDPELIIQARKDFIDRLKSSPSKWNDLIKQQIKDTFQRRENDPNSLVAYGFQDFRGREVLGMPVYFVERLKDGQQDVSRDASSTLAAFANMAIEFNELSKINDILETGRNVIKERKVSERKSDKPMVEQFRALGKKVINYINKTETPNFVKVYNELLESQLYGRYLKEGDDLFDGKINTRKAASFINRVTSLNQLALNALAGVAALGTDSLTALEEAYAGEHFTRGDLFHADGIYFKNLMSHLSETGSNLKNNKLSLFLREFDILHNFKNDIRNKKYGKNRWLKILGDESLLYIFMNMGSHFGETRVALAIANNIKLKQRDNTITLWDAYKVVPNDPNDKSLGSHLELKEGVTQLDGSPIDEEFLTAYKNKALGVNQNLFGIYNEEDMNLAQKTALGSMAMLYRKHIMPAVKRRFVANQYNAMLDAREEGFYITGYKIARQFIDEVILAKNSFAVFKEQMSSFEKSQFIRLVVEMASIVGLWALFAIGKGLDWDDKDAPYPLKMITYQSRRIRTELSAFSPLGITGEAWQIIKSPMAAINVVESTVDMLDILWPLNWMDEVQSGRFKGHSKAYKSLMKSPLMPTVNTIYRGLHPEQALQYYNLK